MGTASVARGIIGGIAGAAGDPQTQQEMVTANQQAAQQKQNELKAKVAPLALGIKNLQTGIQSAYGQYQQAHPDWQGDFDQWKTGPGAQQFGQFADQTQHAVHSMREILHPDWTPGPTEWLKTHLTDRAHITNADHRAEDRANDQAWNQYDEKQFTQTAQNNVKPNPLSPQEQTQAAKIKAGLTPKDTTEQERFVTDYMRRNPTAKAEDALKVYRDSTTGGAAAGKMQEPEPLEKGGVLYGVKDPITGKQYLPTDMDKPDTPQNVKEIWKTVSGAQDAKKAEAEEKEERREREHLQTIGAMFGRMGRSEEFQAQMVGYREGYQEYKKQADVANASEDMVKNYTAQYADPKTDKSAADAALVADFTGILARGGRKNIAEQKLAREIGSFSLNAQQWWKKKTTGELPPELRNLYLDYMKSAAKTQREDAENLKPDPPQILSPQGPKTKQLKDSRGKGAPAPAGSDKDPLGVL